MVWKRLITYILNLSPLPETLKETNSLSQFGPENILFKTSFISGFLAESLEANKD